MTRKGRTTTDPPPRSRLSWPAKFGCAFRGLGVGLLGENSFVVHALAAAVVIVVAAWLKVSYAEWLALVIVITLVVTAELLNTAIEHLARAVTREENPHVRNALDVAAAGVLAASLGASLVGLMVLATNLLARQ